MDPNYLGTPEPWAKHLKSDEVGRVSNTTEIPAYDDLQPAPGLLTFDVDRQEWEMVVISGKHTVLGTLIVRGYEITGEIGAFLA